jgi:uncharacterized membrane protein
MTDARLRILAIVLAVAGLVVAAYLTYVHYADAEAVCVGGGGACERVQTSEYAKLAGIPVAVLGLTGYGAIAVASLLRGERAILAASTLALGGAGFSAYLTYLELFVIDAICQWCVFSALLMTAIFAVNAIRMVRYVGTPP